MSVVVNLEENLGFTKVPSSTTDEFRWSRGTYDQSSWTILHQNLEKYKVEQFFYPCRLMEIQFIAILLVI